MNAELQTFSADPKTDQALARSIEESQRRQTFDPRPWHDAGEQALQQAHVRQTLEQPQRIAAWQPKA